MDVPIDEVQGGSGEPSVFRGTVKWFDVVKGYGFVVSPTGDGDILLHKTVLRDAGHPTAAEEGGLSGAALTEMSTRIISDICAHLDGTLPVIGVGGIMSAVQGG